ncbi:MAG: hypothetical protein HKN10_07040 [Myxococcales bacterium]|nr:hypothetical protein [Deltaproteobacteria bacterium]NNE18215.1 hypothetical protein [Myxococcales bacterium]
MSPRLPTHPSCARRAFPLPSIRALALAAWLALAGCGGVTCPEPLSNVDGVCLKLDQVADAELCDGVDNDGDTEIDESWPELGEPCGEGAGMGECVQGSWACAGDGAGVICEGAVGPVAEVCDGKDNDCDGTPDNGPDEVCDGEDNDCDGLIDEGLLSVKAEAFADHATVAAVEGGFVVARLVGDGIRVDTYDASGELSGGLDVVDSPTDDIAFLTSDSDGDRVLVALGQQAFHVLDIRVGAGLVPTVVDTQALHPDWRQGIDFGVYDPPFHPRVEASPPRFLGYRDLITFALNPFAEDSLAGLELAPTEAVGIPILTAFDTAGPFLVWEQGDNLHTGWLIDNGDVELDIDVARGNSPGMAFGKDGPALVYLQDRGLRLSELDGPTFQCAQGRFCNAAIESGDLKTPSGPTGLAYDDARDTWFVVAGLQLAVVGRGDDGPLVEQVQVLRALRDAPNRVDVVVSNGTAAVVHAEERGQSALTFLGCF